MELLLRVISRGVTVNSYKYIYFVCSIILIEYGTRWNLCESDTYCENVEQSYNKADKSGVS